MAKNSFQPRIRALASQIRTIVTHGTIVSSFSEKAEHARQIHPKRQRQSTTIPGRGKKLPLANLAQPELFL